MNSYIQVKEMLETWKRQGLKKAEICVKTAEACLGWPYVWGAYGQNCTTSVRETYMKRSAISSGDAELIRKRCQVLNGSKSSCTGCKYRPNGNVTLVFDCRGFTRWILAQVGIDLKGAGATSQWNTAANWLQKGPINEMPPDKVCCVFKQVNGKTMEHTGLHVGGGRIIHCSVEVKNGSTGEKGWTHYAIPKGLDGDAPAPDTKPTLRKGSSGEYVTLLQTKLIMLGYSLGSYGADGKFGAKTLEAVKKFQSDSGLTADGVVGAKTWEALDGTNVSEELYTVRIPHLHKTDANELAAKYSGASVEKE